MTRENTVNVPREPTEAMLTASTESLIEQYDANRDWDDAKDVIEKLDTGAIYRAMLSAAPLHEGEGEDWSELERLARAATEGPWSVDERLEPECVRGRYDDIVVMETERLSDAAFIAAANPATILKLIASARSALSQEPGVPTPGGEGE